jgi:hypothetical protein
MQITITSDMTPIVIPWRPAQRVDSGDALARLLDAVPWGQAPAPAYCMSLSHDRRAALRERIRTALPFRDDGIVHLIARAWAARGTV